MIVLLWIYAAGAIVMTAFIAWIDSKNLGAPGIVEATLLIALWPLVFVLCFLATLFETFE